ncbi:ferredoxin reductase family protein [Demequina mangrovi]|uniref:Predicted ferric reductase n=1 Tax=Demequina mangrovi TaxID=1043493 RepID=A0A1H6ZEC2_9MICO|nr:ferredoxin reductase family protein [Demequina mangrovi]SEJ49807.1 Predicted ferric reductase [Demequina mangrovi]
MSTLEVYARRARARGWWRDGLEASIYLVAAVGVAFFIASGGLLTTAPRDYAYGMGRVAGIVAAVLVLTQITLISRAPFVERAFGHDRAAAVHTRIGKVAFILMLVHVALIVVVSAQYDGRSVLAQTAAFWDLGWFMVAAQAGLGLFTIVVATSLVAVRSRWRYERWHLVHLLVYLAIAAVVPHQFLEGSTFRGAGAAWWFWLALYTVAIGSFVIFRLVRPLVMMARHDLRVAAVEPEPDGSTSIVMTGRDLDRLGARPGQFMLWRFLDRERWTQAHPWSLSRAPRPDSLRITVKPSGDASTRLAHVAVGTRVLAEGPLGIFSEVSRTAPAAVLLASGIGVTPIRAMLEEVDGPCTVVLRVRSRAEAPLLDEVAALAHERGAELVVVEGPRGAGWGTAAGETLASLVPEVAERDVYVCGPLAWADAVEADARAAGVPGHAIHRERFGW